MTDTEQYVVHFFKKSNDHKPYKTYSLASGILNNDDDLETDIVDEESGQRLPGFKFQFMSSKGKKKAQEYIVLPEQVEQSEQILEVFQRGSQLVRASDALMKQSSKAAT